MARLLEDQSRRIAIVVLALITLTATIAQGTAALFEKPVLVVDPEMHTASIFRSDIDAEGNFAVTGAHDKTVRIWSLKPLTLKRTIRLPSGPGDIGKVFAVAMSPDGQTIAAGGYTSGELQEESIYLFTSIGHLISRIDGLPDVVGHLTFSRDGRFLAAGLGGFSGIRVYDRDKQWSEVARDTDYGPRVYWISFDNENRIATTSDDGFVRLYDEAFRLIGKRKTETGRVPLGVAISPDGSKLVVGFHDAFSVSLLDGRTLDALESPDSSFIDNGNLAVVAWSQDGQTLYAAGTFDIGEQTQIVIWSDAGQGEHRLLSSGAANTIVSIRALPDERILAVAADPHLSVFGADGALDASIASPSIDPRNQMSNFSVSADGTLVDFGFEYGGRDQGRFDVKKLTLVTSDRPDDDKTAAPRQDSLNIMNWEDTGYPTLDGEPLTLQHGEVSRSLAIHPDSNMFVIGTDYWLRAYDSNGRELWRRGIPETAWAANISGDGRLVVVAYGDGTIRWYRVDDGRELLTFFPMTNRTDWVAWTPEGFYHATPGAYGVLQWHVNRGWDAAPDVFPVSEFPESRQPEALPLVLQEMETARALGLALIERHRNNVKLKTGANVAPGAQLHVLAVGVGEYGKLAPHLKLQYAAKDANDVASALLNTQSGLYADVKAQVLTNQDATRDNILKGLGTIRRFVEVVDEGDVVVFMFSGHGALIDGRFHLLPHGIDARGDEIANQALSVVTLRDRLRPIARKSRVLVLLDACRSGAVMADGTQIPIDGDALREALIMPNVTVLTSSQSQQLSRENKNWENGAFTEVLLRALGPDADGDRNGLVSIAELTSHAAKHLPALTNNRQKPGISMRFQSEIFVSGLRQE